MFCKRCGMIFEISDDVKYAQTGGNPKINMKDIINKIISGSVEPIKGIEYVNEADILNSKEFKDLESDQVAVLLNKIPIYVPKSKKEVHVPVNLDNDNQNEYRAYFVCTNCKNYEMIPPKFKIYTQRIQNSRQESQIDLSHYALNCEDMILPRDRNYTCPNKECGSHKDIKIKEQVTKRHKHMHKIIHTCCACKTVWIT